MPPIQAREAAYRFCLAPYQLVEPEWVLAIALGDLASDALEAKTLHGKEQSLVLVDDLNIGADSALGRVGRAIRT